MTTEKPFVKPHAWPVAAPGISRNETLGESVLCVPAANIDETAGEYVITIAVPGFEREHFDIVLKGRVIHISARKEEGIPAGVSDQHEYDFSGWERDFRLPEDADCLMTTANYQRGELCIHIPRSAFADKGEEILKIYVY